MIKGKLYEQINLSKVYFSLNFENKRQFLIWYEWVCVYFSVSRASEFNQNWQRHKDTLDNYSEMQGSSEAQIYLQRYKKDEKKTSSYRC